MTGQIPEYGDTGQGEVIPPPPPGAQPPPASPSASAIVAFVFGILAFITCGPCTGIPALIIGLIELRKIRNNLSSAEGKPFALVGAILGGINSALTLIAVLIYIIIIVFAIAMPGMME
jgi:hypothetical protein